MCACLSDEVLEVSAGSLLAGRAAGWPGRQVREKEIAGQDTGVSARGLNVTVYRKKPEGLIWLAVNEFIEIVADGSQRPACRGNGLGLGRRVCCFQLFEQCFGDFGNLRYPIQTNDGQRALHLMQVGAAELDVSPVFAALLAGIVVLQGLVGPLEGEVDFALDPGQRADIEFCRGVHVMLFLRSQRRTDQLTLKPATEPLSSVARLASSPTAWAVF